MIEPGISVAVARRVKPGAELAYEEWLHGVSEAAGRFAGHLGITVIRPRAGSRDYLFVFRFASESELAAWEASPERTRWLARADEIAEPARVERRSGLEAWFRHPEVATLGPPRWKMVLVTWGVAFPLIQLFSSTIGKLPLDPLVVGALVGFAMVVTMTYAAMPAVTRLLARWLYRAEG